MELNITALVIGGGCKASLAGSWLAPLWTAMQRFHITTPRRAAAFIANIGVETAGFTVLVENLNYSAQGLANTWPSRYAVDPKQPLGKVPNALAKRLARNPQAIANNVYANRMGNGNEASGDGWRNRGRGLMQTTGADNLKACAKAIGIDVYANPELLEQPEAAALSAAFFFSSNGCNELADAGKVDAVVKKINGASPCEANHGALRLSRYKDLLQILKE